MSAISCVSVEREGEEGGREGRRDSFRARTRENSSRDSLLPAGSPDACKESKNRNGDWATDRAELQEVMSDSHR